MSTMQDKFTELENIFMRSGDPLNYGCSKLGDRSLVVFDHMIMFSDWWIEGDTNVQVVAVHYTEHDITQIIQGNEDLLNKAFGRLGIE